MTNNNQSTGNLGENIAAKYLEGQGYDISERNYRIRGGEIDIIAQDRDFLVFVEVKTRYSHEFGLPIEAITKSKMRALLKTAQFYLVKINWGNRPYRLDLVAIDFTFDKKNPEIILVKNITY